MQIRSVFHHLLSYVEKCENDDQQEKKMDLDIPNSCIAAIRRTKVLDSQYFAGLSSPE